MQLTEKDINWFKPLEKNVRKHNDTQITALAESIQTYGVTRPMVCDEDGTVLVGNGLLAALKKLGKPTASCLIIPNLTETQKKKLIVTDNHVYDLGYTDASVQIQYIRDIISDGDMDIPGFDDDILNALKAEMNEAGNNIVEKMDNDNFTMDESTAQKIQQEAQEYVVPPKTMDYTPAPANASPAASYAPSEGSSAPTQEDGDYIEVVCPHCGQKIKVRV